jgi:hypothetical protein
VVNVYEPTERRFPSSSLWTSIVNVTHVFQCLNVVMFNISLVFEIFASHPQPPNEGLGVPCPKLGTTTWIANPTWSKKCMQIYLQVRVIIQRLKPLKHRVADPQRSILGILDCQFLAINHGSFGTCDGKPNGRAFCGLKKSFRMLRKPCEETSTDIYCYYLLF